MKLLYVAVIIIACLFVSSIGFVAFLQLQSNPGNNSDEIKQEEDELNPVAINSYHDAINSFSFDFFKVLYGNDGENVFFSPYSIFTALAMTYEGAKEETAIEMKDILNVEQDNTSFHTYMRNIYDVLNKEDSDYDISTANALWVKENFHLLETYLSIIRDYYGGEATEVDFSNPAEAAAIINEWVEEHTNNLIKDLITEDTIDSYTALILTNAIYFKGVWEIQFDPVNTTNETFEVSSENSIEAPTMKIIGTEDMFYYTETDEIQVLELPYTGDDLSMVILLPKDNDLSSIISTMDNSKYSELISSLSEENVDIYLPKFKIETSYSLKNYLKELGMSKSFTSDADFSGITGAKDLFIDEVLHKAFIDVNEEGTEAAAATAVVMKLTSTADGPTRFIFNCDHPFIYIIQHKETGTILFMGVVSNPLE